MMSGDQPHTSAYGLIELDTDKPHQDDHEQNQQNDNSIYDRKSRTPLTPRENDSLDEEILATPSGEVTFRLPRQIETNPDRRTRVEPPVSGAVMAHNYSKENDELVRNQYRCLGNEEINRCGAEGVLMKDTLNVESRGHGYDNMRSLVAEKSYPVNPLVLERSRPQFNYKQASLEGSGWSHKFYTLPDGQVFANTDRWQRHLGYDSLQADTLGHLKTVYENCKPNLSEDQLVEVKRLLIKYQDVFPRSKTDLGRTDRIQHRVNTGLAPPIKQQPRRVPISMREGVEKEIQHMIDADLIEPSSGPWSSPIVPFKKKSGEIRLCIDCRKINAVCLKDSYPLPRTRDCLDSLQGAKWFSTLDCTSGCYQVQMHPVDKDKTSFVCHKGQFAFKVMPMGMCNSASTYQRLMQLIMTDLQYETLLIYLDDLIHPCYPDKTKCCDNSKMLQNDR